jgi:hypothetical protein
MRSRNRLILLAVVLIALALVGFVTFAVVSRGVVVTVTNSGNNAMTRVQASLGKKQIDLGDIPAGASAKGRVVPAGDSDVVISFVDPSGTTQSVQIDTYVTNGMKGRVDVDVADGTLKGFKSNLRVGFP